MNEEAEREAPSGVANDHIPGQLAYDTNITITEDSATPGQVSGLTNVAAIVRGPDADHGLAVVGQ
jgi:hypothetical protein